MKMYLGENGVDTRPQGMVVADRVCTSLHILQVNIKLLSTHAQRVWGGGLCVGRQPLCGQAASVYSNLNTLLLQWHWQATCYWNEMSHVLPASTQFNTFIRCYILKKNHLVCRL